MHSLYPSGLATSIKEWFPTAPSLLDPGGRGLPTGSIKMNRDTLRPLFPVIGTSVV
jgi:hypothetical protein